MSMRADGPPIFPVDVVTLWNVVCGWRGRLDYRPNLEAGFMANRFDSWTDQELADHRADLERVLADWTPSRADLEAGRKWTRTPTAAQAAQAELDEVTDEMAARADARWLHLPRNTRDLITRFGIDYRRRVSVLEARGLDLERGVTWDGRVYVWVRQIRRGRRVTRILDSLNLRDLSGLEAR